MNFMYQMLDDNNDIIFIELSQSIAEKLSPLPDSVDHYFQATGNEFLVPMRKLINSRARTKGVINANALMLDAYHGRCPRRQPISVSAYPDGYWIVKDGNSTVINAIASNWKYVMCQQIKENI